MGKKLVVATFKNEPRWHLDGKLVEGFQILQRGGVETIGRIVFDGDEPPGIPVFEMRFAGVEESHRTPVSVDTDEFRWPSAEESKGGPHPIRRGFS